MIDKIIEQQETIKGMQENEESAIKIMKMYEEEKKKNQKAIEYIKNNTYKIEWGDLEQDNEDINISEDLTEKEFIESLLEILDKGE